MILWPALFYLLALILIGIFTFGRNKSAADFFLAGNRLGFIPVAFATMASIMSGFVFVGGPGLFYRTGLSSIWIIISSSFTGALMCWVLAKPLYRMARENGCLTIPELLRTRFNCRVSSGLAAFSIVLGVLGYLATQLKALSIILSNLLNVSEVTALLIGLAVLAFYSAAGGITASVYTDIIQGSIMLWTSVMVFYFALQRSGGFQEMSGQILESEPEILNPFGHIGPIAALSWFVVFALGSLGQPHVIHKFMMIKSLRILRLFPLILAGSMMVCGLVWLGIGLSVKASVLKGFIAAPNNPDDAVNLFLNYLAPDWLGVIIYVGILSAIMSTVDSFVNVGSAALTCDIPQAFKRGFKNQVLWARLWTIALLLVALLFALKSNSLVATLGIMSFGLFAAALTPSLTLGLNWKKVDNKPVMWSVLSGILFSVLFYVLKTEQYLPERVSPELMALMVSFFVFLIVFEIRTRKSS
jgi:SSS family transporter